MPRGLPERCDSGISIPRRAAISNAQDGDTRGETTGSPLIGRAVIIETSFSVGASSPKRSEMCGFQVSTGQRGMSKGMGPNVLGRRMM